MDLVFLLEESGFPVVEAADADEAFEPLKKTEVAALLTDIDIPGSMDGIALARLTAERWPDCRIVVISGRHSPKPDSLPDGAAFIPKPISEDSLTSTLQGVGIHFPKSV